MHSETQIGGATPTDEVVAVFVCGPNRTCEHEMNGYVDILDTDGRPCGSTLVCSKCGETAFNLSMWDGI